MAIRFDRFTVKAQQAIQQAQSRAAELGNPELQPVHLLLALVEDREGVIPAVLEKIGVPVERLESDLRHRGKTSSRSRRGRPAWPEPSLE